MKIPYKPNKFNHEENLLIEKAISFLLDKYRESGSNPKPVIFHSIRVASLMTQLGFDAQTIAASYLHDLIEDSNVDYKLIESEFGTNIAKTVELTSFDSTIKNKRDRYKDMFNRISESNNISAISLKAADILDNSTYYQFGGNYESEKILIEKMQSFVYICNKKIPNTSITLALTSRFDILYSEFSQKYN